MKKFLKIALIVILIITVIVGALVVWQWSNIKAVFMALKYSSEEIDTLADENEAKINKILNELTKTDMRPLSDEERKKLLSGELSEEDAINIIKNNSPDNAGAQDNNVSAGGNSASQNNGKPNNSSNTDDIIARIYLLRAEYVNALSSLESAAKSAAMSVPNKEWTVSKRLDLADTYTGKAVALEKECDAKMEALIGELKTELQKNGGNTGVISDIRSVYASEKELKKSQLLSKYEKYLK